MKGPKPTIKIEGDCSTIHSDTFYVYSPDGFASISLKEGEYWKSLPSPDHMVTSPACVQGSEGDENFYLVGGTGSPDNSGLQRFSFSTGKWETLTSTSPDMKNRTGHGAGYIPSTSRILVYAGNTDGSTQISQSTLIISTKDGSFDVSSVTAQGAPALYEPMILPWSSSEVAMIGGSPTNTDIFIYDSNKGFGKSEATLPSAIQSSSRCALASNSGGKTKVLEEFTMIASPNTVTSYLLSSKGKIQNPATVIAPSEKRDITDSYNGTFAPTASWSDYTLAQGSGLVVLASGQSNDSLAIFNQTSNSWVNSTELFYGKPDQNVLKASTTSFTSSTPTSTSSTSTSTSASATPTSSSPVVAAVGSGLSDHGKLILGATLGSVLGFGLILLILLFLLRREKKKRQAAQPGGGGDNKDRLSFQDQGIEPLTEGAYPMARSPVPLAATSVDSLAIMSGKYKGEKSSNRLVVRAMDCLLSPRAAVRSLQFPPVVSWAHQVVGKYFEDGGTTTFQSDRSTVSSAYTKSDYRGSGWPMSTLTPLNFGFLEQPKPLGRVPSGSPTTEHGPPDMGSRSLVIPESQSARISSADSISIASDDDRDDSKWQGAGQSSWLGRPSSSNYTTSFYQTSTQDMPWESSNPSLAEKPRQPNARRSSVIIPHDIHELPMQGQKNTTNSDMSWLNLKADR
ncbi:Galactose oxidase/kelch beta-propeller [Penicillium cf. griseofulvum]|nr:Galactose oxidase/kelch beta-propeller [Penicillium cf. griseofulvum]